MKQFLPVLVTGFVAGVLHVVPFFKGLTCCLIVPVAAYFAIVLDRKANNFTGKVNMNKAAIFGLLTGIIAALFGSFFEVMITYITKSNDIVNSFAEISQSIDNLPFSSEVKEQVFNLMESVRDSIKDTGFSPLYAISILLNNLIVNPVFGLIGGLVGAKVLNSKISNS